MKLAEALIERAELQKKNAQLIGRILSNTKVQEGDSPAEEPEELIKLYEKNMLKTSADLIFRGWEWGK